MLGVEGGALIEKGFAWGFGVGVVERALRTETVVMGDEAQLQSGNLLGCKESVHVNLHGGVLVTTAASRQQSSPSSIINKRKVAQPSSRIK